jgi:nucleotide-binding universal stress UspA family protein
MFENVIVPLDTSRLAESALPYAEELAAKMDSNITLLTVIGSENGKNLEDYYQYITKIKEATKDFAAKYVDNGQGKEIKVEIANQEGNPAEGIIEYSLKSEFPLIVMASRGQSGISRWAVGSVADKVVRSVNHKPVMLIRTNKSHADIREKRLLKKALVPLDGSFSSEAVVPYISNIVYKLEMELTLLKVVPGKNNDETDAESYLQGVCRKVEDVINMPVKSRVATGPVAETIIDLADELTVDLVAMSTHGMNRNNPLALGSIAQKVFLGGNTPLLLIKN